MEYLQKGLALTYPRHSAQVCDKDHLHLLPAYILPYQQRRIGLRANKTLAAETARATSASTWPIGNVPQTSLARSRFRAKRWQTT